MDCYYVIIISYIHFLKKIVKINNLYIILLIILFINNLFYILKYIYIYKLNTYILIN